MSKYTAAEDGAIADLTGSTTDTPVNTPAEVVETPATPEQTETVVEAAKTEDTPKQEPTEPTDTYEKRYKDLQKVFTKDREKLKQLDTVAEENAKLRDYLGRVNAYLQAQRGNQPPVQEDDTELPTVQKVQEIVKTVIERERQNILTEADKKIAAAKVEEYKFQYAKDIGKYAQDLIEAEPLLKAQIDDPEDTSLFESMVKHAQNKLFGPQSDPDEPRDIDAFKAEMKAYATRKAKSLQKLISNHEQAAMARAVKANTPSMASPGGKTAAVQAPSKAPKFGSQQFKDWLAQGLSEEQAAVSSRK